MPSCAGVASHSLCRRMRTLSGENKRDRAHELTRVYSVRAGGQTHIAICAPPNRGRRRGHLESPRRKLREHTTQFTRALRAEQQREVSPARTLLVHKLLDVVGVRARLGSGLICCRFRFLRPLFAGVIVECAQRRSRRSDHRSLRAVPFERPRGLGRIH